MRTAPLRLEMELLYTFQLIAIYHLVIYNDNTCLFRGVNVHHNWEPFCAA